MIQFEELKVGAYYEVPSQKSSTSTYHGPRIVQVVGMTLNKQGGTVLQVRRNPTQTYSNGHMSRLIRKSWNTHYRTGARMLTEAEAKARWDEIIKPPTAPAPAPAAAPAPAPAPAVQPAVAPGQPGLEALAEAVEQLAIAVLEETETLQTELRAQTALLREIKAAVQSTVTVRRSLDSNAIKASGAIG